MSLQSSAVVGDAMAHVSSVSSGMPVADAGSNTASQLMPANNFQLAVDEIAPELPVNDEAGVPLQDPSSTAACSFLSDYQQTAALQPIAEPVVSEKTGGAVFAEPGTSNLDAMVTYAGTLPSTNRQIPPSQIVAEPVVMRGHTEAVHAESGVPGLDAHDGKPPSADMQDPPLENTSRDGKLPSNNQQVLPLANQQKTTTMFSAVGITPPTNTSVPPTNVVPQGESPHPSAFSPVKANSPHDERPNLESPLRSPVEREKKETLMAGSIIQTSSLWDTEPQLAMSGLIVPAATSPNLFVPVSRTHDHSTQADQPVQSSIKQTGDKSQLENVAKPISGIPGFTQTTYPFTATSTKSSNQSLTNTPGQQIPPINAPSTHSEPSIPCDQGAAQVSTSSVSRQSSLAGSSASQDQATGKIVRDGDKVSGVSRGTNQE